MRRVPNLCELAAGTQVASIPAEHLKKPLKIKFRGEEGVDEGGVRKEFFQVLLRELFDRRYGAVTWLRGGKGEV